MASKYTTHTDAKVDCVVHAINVGQGDCILLEFKRGNIVTVYSYLFVYLTVTIIADYS